MSSEAMRLEAVSSEALTSEVELDARKRVDELSRCLRDVLGLLALPAVWRGKDPLGIVTNLAEIFESAFAVDVLAASVRWRESTVRIARLSGRDAGARVDEVHGWFSHLSGTSAAIHVVSAGELGRVYAVCEPLAYGGAQGHIFACSRMAGFPSSRELVIIKTAVALATTALDTASALADRESALRSKDEFMAVLGHELRNPLAPIVSALDVMQARKSGAVSREEAIMRRQVQHMGRLVDDLLDVSRIARGLMVVERSPMEISSVLWNAVESVDALIKAKRHALSVDVPATGLLVEADRVRLAQVFANLLSNAAKYTPAGGRIALRARLRDQRAVVTVRDNGQGIAPELAPRVFEKFVQGRESTDAQYGGLGLGLSIVKHLVELHGGVVSVSSEGLGQGAEFSVELPLAAADALPASQPPPRAALESNPRGAGRVLVVDDNADAAETLGEMLALSGYEVQIETDARRTVAAVGDFRPQVAILDLGMPDMSGFEVAELLRSSLSDPPALIALTGYGQPGDRRRTKAAGFSAHLVKPVDVRALLDLLGSLMQKRADASRTS